MVTTTMRGSHKVALYRLDWETGKATQVTLRDASGTVRDRRILSPGEWYITPEVEKGQGLVRFIELTEL